jgi:hypothetical protein
VLCVGKQTASPTEFLLRRGGRFESSGVEGNDFVIFVYFCFIVAKGKGDEQKVTKEAKNRFDPDLGIGLLPLRILIADLISRGAEWNRPR